MIFERFLNVDNDLTACECSETDSVIQQYWNVPYIGKESRCFVSLLAKTFYVKFDVRVSAMDT